MEKSLATHRSGWKCIFADKDRLDKFAKISWFGKTLMETRPLETPGIGISVQTQSQRGVSVDVETRERFSGDT